MPTPNKLLKWMQQPNCVVTAAEWSFLNAVERCASGGVGYGFMMQTIEWMWQEQAEASGLPGSAWGPEYFKAQIAELERTVADLRAQLKQLSPS